MCLLGFVIVPYLYFAASETQPEIAEADPVELNSESSSESLTTDIRQFAFEELVAKPGVVEANDTMLIQLVKDKYLFYPEYYEVKSTTLW